MKAFSPGSHWDTRVEALKAFIQIHTGERKQGNARLEAAVETLIEAEMQDWIVMLLPGFRGFRRQYHRRENRGLLRRGHHPEREQGKPDPGLAGS